MKKQKPAITIAGSIIIPLVMLLVGPAQAAVTFNVTPTSVSNTYAGNITLQDGGVTNFNVPRDTNTKAGHHPNIELQYIGNGQFMPLSYDGPISAY